MQSGKGAVESKKAQHLSPSSAATQKFALQQSQLHQFLAGNQVLLQEGRQVHMPIKPLLLDESVSEIMGIPDASWFCERDGRLCQEPTIAYDASRLRAGLEVIANQLGKKFDADNPLLGAHLPDGSRLAAVIPPVVSPAPSPTIRKFNSRHYTIDDLIARGTLTRPLADFLAALIRDGNTLLISGGTGTGKTTIFRILAVREVLALRGYDRDAKRFLIEPVFEVQHAAA
jgi:Flp pilus assembly CpaF family ATPase